ncbi:MAG: zinc ribbon domain-containing protein [Candidatus Helarchaeota archaeon]
MAIGEKKVIGRQRKSYNRKKQSIYYTLLVILGFFMILSNFLSWDTYITMNTALIYLFSGQVIPIVKTFTPLTWVWSDLLPFLSYVPLLAGLFLLIGEIFYFLEYKSGKKIMVLSPVFSILIYSLYVIIFWMIPELYKAFSGGGIMFWLEGLRIPNEIGAYLCLIPGILSIPFIALIQMPEIEEEEPEALKELKVAVPWKKGKQKKGEQFCAQCGALIKEGEAFCNQCGTYI